MTPVRTSALRKGSPPPRRATPPTTPLADPRAAEEKRWPLQLMVPPSTFDAFSAEAGRRFGSAVGRSASHEAARRAVERGRVAGHRDPRGPRRGAPGVVRA